jgi:transposase
MSRDAPASDRQSAAVTVQVDRLGPLPLVNHVLDRLGLPALLEQDVPTPPARCALSYARGLGVVLRSIIVEREPIYRQQELTRAFTPAGFGLTAAEAAALRDDQLGRALDRLFAADRGTLLTAVVVAAVQQFGVRLAELHNDSTTVSFTGQYREARGRAVRGKRAPAITYGHSKQHRPDLKQLLVILTTSADGGVPVQFRCADGNTADDTTHIETWETLCQLAGRRDFLYVADCKLCTGEQMDYLDRRQGRFVTVLPRSRYEDAEFREWILTHTPEWDEVWNRPHPRRREGPRDIWRVFRFPLPSRESWPVSWVWSTLLALHQDQARRERLTRASQELDEVQRALAGPRPRRRTREAVEAHVRGILARLQVTRYLHVQVLDAPEYRYRQEQRGRPGPATRYRRITRERFRLDWHTDEDALAHDRASDGMFPLVTNDRTLTPRAVLEAYKRQPVIERRFAELKTVHEIAPVFLKNEGRIEAFFFLYFLALLVQALIEREVRRAMQREGIVELALYPEARGSRRPTAEQILRLFSLVERHTVLAGDQILHVVEPALTPLQRQVLHLLGIPERFYRGPDADQ